MMPPPHGYPGMPMYAPYPPHPPPHMQMPGPPPPGFQHMHHFPPPVHTAPAPSIPRPPSPSTQEVRQTEPLPHDLSNSEALAKNFGVSAAIVGDLKLTPNAIDTEDLAVGSSGLASRRDRDIAAPHDSAKWVTVTTRASQASSPIMATPASDAPDIIWLPKDRDMVRNVLDAYFTRLNYHRPVFTRSTFEKTLETLYAGTAPHDPGYVCSLYLILALGTLSELNHRVNGAEKEGQTINPGPGLRKLLPADWPSSEEFFDRALAVKPDLRVTISSLQALILLHWYLYTERQGRTLWRLVGSMVRLAIELGLHHDPHVVPSEENPDALVFSEEECQLRIRLWAIVLLHDRGTSILLGRPLAIAPSDSNTPRPGRGKPNELSEHFSLSAPIAEIQADIINSLYAPTRQSADSIMRHASRILKSMVEFRRQLPDSYKWYFNGTDDWALEKRKKLVQDITEDEGLTLLKIGITRILLLRALFSSKELPFHSRLRALIDAIVTSHNIIVVHHQLIRFPDIAFFVSPIPLHIAAMVILYGHMSKCDRLPREVALEDVWMALDMLPSFRWRWERKDLKGGHPLIAKLAEEVLKVNLHQVSPTAPPMLISEADWDTDVAYSPKSQHPATPTLSSPYPPSPYTKSPTVGPTIKGSPGKPSMAHLHSTSSRDEKLAEVPPGLFYPFYPENPSTGSSTSALLNASQSISSFGFQPSQESFMLEEKDQAPATAGMHVWPPNGHTDGRNMQPPFNPMT
ncbi:hypothetical protein PHLGIDRAFT_84228 [Phlebiopsis gigantea 11061_1 CR5-6]|uniref:Xylanolytic transcriptional activator regulatory domain-containing protein n=1 Tax=Phlebiopsis gigantea (strain 11061_1 CR5-6) TaxID=745531 RepID=A0A0C3SEX0_PHLG1|nr:hypothetical protein PHLGIDRAFT_84228 [Phlebiopsis gigantea 11061_1 CR5-6]